mgnify:CR=1 FL=1
MKISIISEDGYPFSIGGVSQWTNYLISALRNVQFDIVALKSSAMEKCVSKIPENVGDVVQIVLNSSKFSYHNALKNSYSERRDMSFIPELLEFIFFGNRDFLKHLSDSKRPRSESRIVACGAWQQHAWEAIVEMYEKTFHDRPFSQYYHNIVSILSPLIQLSSCLGRIPKADAYHALNTGFAGFLALLSKIANQKPMLVTEHGIYVREREAELSHMPIPTWVKQLWLGAFKHMTNLVRDYADIVTTVCESNKHLIVTGGVSPQKVKVIPNAIDTDSFKPNGEKKNNIFVGTVARITRFKGILNFIEAAELVIRKYPEAKFVVVGPVQDVDYYEQCKAHVRQLGLEGKLSFATDDSPLDWYNRLKVFALPSICEGQPLAVLEAMACELPVVCTNVGGVQEVVGETGILVPPHNPSYLADSICQLLGDTDFANKLGKASRDRVIDRFGLRNFGKNYERLYETYAEGSSGAS